jgi:hypothetical protein
MLAIILFTSRITWCNALAVAMVKRMREVIWGVPFLLSLQWIEGRRLRRV